MSFADRENSRDKGQPVELYFFRYGPAPTAYHAYTDASEEITFEDPDLGPITFRPIPIERDKITASSTLDKAALTVRMPTNLEVPEMFRIASPTNMLTLTLRQGHENDPDNEFLVSWTGRVISCERQKFEAILTCEPASTSMRRTGLRRHYQLSCPHVLYGDRCKADLNASTYPSTAEATTPTTVTVAAGWSGAIDPSKFLNGLFGWFTATAVEYRTILRVDGNTLELSGSTAGLEVGMPVNIALGCNHQESDCLNLHNNINNYGGQPWIPTKNPINQNPFTSGGGSGSGSLGGDPVS